MLDYNTVLNDLPVYQPGRPIEEVARELGMPVGSIAKLASNENPLGPSASALQAMKQAIERVNLYPDGNAYYLKKTIGETCGLPSGQIILGNGSNELIEFVGHALLKPGTNIVVSQYCFAIYPIVARLFGADVITVPAVDYGSDLAAMADAVSDETRILFLANPNNPTGTLSASHEVLELIEQIPESVLVVIDEAYFEYLKEPLDLLPKVREGRKNLMLMRTFSKIHGLAGLRLGYGLGSKELITALEKIRQPFNANLVAQSAAEAALLDRDHVVRSREHNQKELDRIEACYREEGWGFVPSFANFTLLKVGDGAAVNQGLLREGIITRPMAGYGLGEWLRISIGTEAENDRCLAALKKLL